jgi:putative restriction endonuclease
MQAYVAVTDPDWFRFLSQQPGIDEVNFWKPGGGTNFRALTLGGPLLFKLHWPDNYIVGGGFFASFSRLPVSLVWETFGVKNGAASYAQMRARIEHYRESPPNPREDYVIGNIILEEPFFLPRDRWIPAPDDFARSVVQGKTYDLTTPAGRVLWEQVLAARAGSIRAVAERPVEVEGAMFGEAQRGRVRLGQGAFRVMVTDAYDRRCAISGEKALPVLQAAHIQPVTEGGLHRLDNGLLLRSDVHTLFDRGYITVTPEHRIEVAAQRLKDDFDNGEPYVPFHGTPIHLPRSEAERPLAAQLAWHNENVYRG